MGLQIQPMLQSLYAAVLRELAKLTMDPAPYGCCCRDGDAMCMDCLKGSHDRCRWSRELRDLIEAVRPCRVCGSTYFVEPFMAEPLTGHVRYCRECGYRREWVSAEVLEHRRQQYAKRLLWKACGPELVLDPKWRAGAGL